MLIVTHPLSDRLATTLAMTHSLTDVAPLVARTLTHELDTHTDASPPLRLRAALVVSLLDRPLPHTVKLLDPVNATFAPVTELSDP